MAAGRQFLPRTLDGAMASDHAHKARDDRNQEKKASEHDAGDYPVVALRDPQVSGNGKKRQRRLIRERGDDTPDDNL